MVASTRRQQIVNKSADVVRKLSTDGGVLPLEVLITSMRDCWRVAQDGSESTQRRDDARVAACQLANVAAPYFHPRLATVQHNMDERAPGVVRLPAIVKDIEDWKSQYAPKTDSPRVEILPPPSRQ